MEPFIEFIGTLQNSGFWLVKEINHILLNSGMTGSPVQWALPLPSRRPARCQELARAKEPLNAVAPTL